jgi:hypothetical protein
MCIAAEWMGRMGKKLFFQQTKRTRNWSEKALSTCSAPENPYTHEVRKMMLQTLPHLRARTQRTKICRGLLSRFCFEFAREIAYYIVVTNGIYL